ncbi:Phosphate regulon response regulator, partial [human gut metagenome]
DIMLPIDDGLTILKSLRENGMTKDIPVIMTTAKGTEFDKVKGLDLGADDYLVKPFGMMEMISRIKAVLRRTSNQEQETHLTIKNLALDSKNYTVRKNGQKIELTLKEFELLSLLMLNPDRVFTRQ